MGEPKLRVVRGNKNAGRNTPDDAPDARDERADDIGWDMDTHRPGEEHERVQKILADLKNPKTRFWTYMRVALTSASYDAKQRKYARCLDDTEYRMLAILLFYADRDLSNCFPRINMLHLTTCYSERQAHRIISRLTEKGWLRTYTFRADGKQSSSGRQFLIPAGALAPWDNGWEGPVNFSKK